MNAANPNVAAFVRARLLNVAKERPEGATIAQIMPALASQGSSG